ncbi:MAG: molecular chaperone HscC [Pirellula sp.]|nr:molecular chaperone HscC [Pirellula sp.]
MAIVGIDLGTTNSAIGCYVEGKPKLLPNPLGNVLTPSVVGVDDDGTLIVGEAARELQVIAPHRCASIFKRHMGTDWSTELNGLRFDAANLSAAVLRSLLCDATHHLGEVVDRAVISVPAYFNERQRRATIAAGELAGIKVERILNEPTAASIAYGLHDDGEEKVIAVLDLGGGTYDVSIVAIFGGVVEVQASSGECFLGGEDFTSAIVSRLLEREGLIYEHAEIERPLLVSRMRRLCETVKLELSRETETQTRMPSVSGDAQWSDRAHRISRDEFERWTEPLLDRTEPPLRRALGDAKITVDDVDMVVLVGGATRMPSFRDRVTRRFGKSPQCSIDPDQVVALGATIQAGLLDRDEALDDLVVTDVSPFTLGVETSKDFGTEVRSGYFTPIIFRNQPIPASRSKAFATMHANQTTITLKVFQGESRLVEGNVLLGELDVEGIPLGPRGQQIECRFTYDLNGVLEVEATIVETQEKKTLVISRNARPLSESELHEALEAMRELKTDPRDKAQNRLLMKRAERVIEEMPMGARNELESLLDGFEEAMSARDDAVTARFQTAIQELLDQWEMESRRDR